MNLVEARVEAARKYPMFTQQQLKRIDFAVDGGAPGDVIVNKFGLDITREDLNTLVGNGWLNDQIINFYLKLMVERSVVGQELGLQRVYTMSTFFIIRLLQGGYQAVQSWTNEIDIFSYDVIPVPKIINNNKSSITQSLLCGKKFAILQIFVSIV
jgi:sentrin-specific protease 1